MKHITRALAGALAAALLLGGCAKTVRPEDVAGKTYCYEKDGFGGAFTITLEEDGTFTYYEGGLSSYIGMGKWTLEGDTVTLDDGKQGLKRFTANGTDLVYQGKNSREFIYVKVADGEKFSAVTE